MIDDYAPPPPPSSARFRPKPKTPAKRPEKRKPLPPKAVTAITVGVFAALFALAGLYHYVTARSSAYSLALEAEGRGDEAETLANLILALKDDPAHLDARLRLARIYEKKGALDDAVTAYKTALRYAPANADARLAVAEVYLRKNMEYQALQELESLLAEQPANVEVHLRVARIYADRKTWDKVTREAEAVLATRPDDGGALALLALAQARGGLPGPAEATARKAIAADAAGLPARVLLSEILLAKGDADGALREAQAAVDAKFDEPDAHFALGAAQEKKGNADAAIREFKIAVERKPGFAMAQLRLGIAYQGKGIMDRALESLDQALKAGGDDKDLVAEARKRIREIKAPPAR